MDVVFIDHYDSFSFNVIDWLTGKYGLQQVRRIPYDDKIAIEHWLQDPTPFVMSPGPKSPDQALSTLNVCRKLLGKVPILGICLGHQILGSCLGGRVVKSNHLFHGSKRLITLDEDFAERCHLPRSYTAGSYNSLIIAENSLPGEVSIIARNQFGEIEGIFYPSGDYAALGLQHHPESFLSSGHEAILNLWQQWVDGFYQEKPCPSQPFISDQTTAKAPLSMPS